MPKISLLTKIVFVFVLISLLLTTASSMAKSANKKAFEKRNVLVKPRKIKSVIKQRAINLSINDPQGQTWAGSHLWVADDETDRLYKIDPSNGKIIQSISSPGPQPRGLTWDGKNLFCSDNETKKIYKLNPNNGNLISSIDAPVSKAINAPLDSVRGLAWDGEYLWSAYYAGWGSKINRVNPETGEVDKYFFPGGIPQELACDGEYLYCVNNNNYLKKKDYDQYNYIRRFKLSDLNLSDYIKIPSIHPRGLAFDGHAFWYLDKNAKKAYQIKLQNE